MSDDEEQRLIKEWIDADNALREMSPPAPRLDASTPEPLTIDHDHQAEFERRQARVREAKNALDLFRAHR